MIPAVARAVLERLAGRLAPALAQRFLDAVVALRGGVDVEALAARIEAGDTEGALRTIFGTPEAVAALNGVGDAVRVAIRTAGQAWAADVRRTLASAALSAPAPPALLPSGRLAAVDVGVQTADGVTPAAALRFAELHPATRQALAAAHDAVLTGTADAWVSGARVAVIDAVTRTSEQGLNPRVAARRVRDQVGQSPYDQQLVANYRRELETGDPAALERQLRDARSDAVVARAVSGERPLTPAQVDAYTARYAEHVQAWRAETAARTIALDAARQGQDAVWAQAVADGSVRADTLTVEWHTRLDGRERPQHHRMHHARVIRGTPFHDPRTPREWRVVGEGDWGCRCVGLYRVHATPGLAAAYVREGSGVSARYAPAAPAARQTANDVGFRPRLPG